MNDEQQGLDPYAVINNLADQVKSQAIQIAMLTTQNTELKRRLAAKEDDHE